MSITRERILEFLEFNPETGDFLWKKNKGTARSGRLAGCVRKNGYRSIDIDCRRYLCHRLAWVVMHGRMPDNVIDHIDGNKLNNRPGNLRDVVQRINFHNQTKPRKNNTSGYKGVTWSKQHRKYVAQIMVNRKQINLGLFRDPTEAHKRYLRAKVELGVA